MCTPPAGADSRRRACASQCDLPQLRGSSAINDASGTGPGEKLDWNQDLRPGKPTDVAAYCTRASAGSLSSVPAVTLLGFTSGLRS